MGRKRTKVIWSREQVARLYCDEDKTLQQIGNILGVTRERVRQVMDGYSIPRRKDWDRHKPQAPRFTSLSDYLARGKDIGSTLRKFLPENSGCAECGSSRHIHIHHITYPAIELKDIQFLCASCHNLKHKGKTTLLLQIDIYNEYRDGISTINLAAKYNISRVFVYKIIHKIKTGSHTF